MTADFQDLINPIKRFIAVLVGDSVTPGVREFHMILFDFDVNKSDLKPEHTTALDNLINQSLRRLPDAFRLIRIIGRASQTGPEAHNQALATLRAENVYQYLVDHHAPTRFLQEVKGEGSLDPLVDSAGQEEGINRCVEIVYEFEAEAALLLGQDPRRATAWNINLGSAALSLSVSVIGGQVVLGQLTKKPFRQTPVTKNVALFIVGLDLSKGIQDLKGFEVADDVGIGLSVDLGSLPGDFEMPVPVDFDYFDGCYAGIVNVEAGLGVGSGGGGLWIGRTADTSVFVATGGISTGVIYEAGVTIMGGVISVLG